MTQLASSAVQLDIWSDYVCPFCYLEMPELARLAETYGDQLSITWRAFELRPDPVPTLDPDGAYLHRVWNRSVYPMAAARGMVLRLPPVQPRSRAAFEAVAFAREQSRFDAMHEALFRAFFVDGRDLADRQVLVDIGVSAGLDARALEEALVSGRFLGLVMQDEHLAAELGLHGVPAMVAHRTGSPERLHLSGAQSYAALEGMVRQLL
jgi:predicted DsbA family dithiol-disulfide isomerase